MMIHSTRTTITPRTIQPVVDIGGSWDGTVRRRGRAKGRYADWSRPPRDRFAVPAKKVQTRPDQGPVRVRAGAGRYAKKRPQARGGLGSIAGRLSGGGGRRPAFTDRQRASLEAVPPLATKFRKKVFHRRAKATEVPASSARHL